MTSNSEPTSKSEAPKSPATPVVRGEECSRGLSFCAACSRCEACPRLWAGLVWPVVRELAARCRVPLLDEATRAIDVGAKAEVYEMIGELVGQGVAILLISSDLPELLGLADRVAVMHEGRLQGILPRVEATQEAVMRLALGAGRAGGDVIA